MRYVIRELYYLLSHLHLITVYPHLKIGFRATVNPKSVFGGYNKIEHHSNFNGSLGFGSYIGEYSNVSGEIGNFTSIAGHVTCLTSTHPTDIFVSTSPSFYSTLKQNGLSLVKTQKFEEYPKLNGSNCSVKIGNDVYIGYGSLIIGPIVIGDGAIIAAGAVVTHDVDPYSIVAGCPAKEIRKRFSKSQIDKLEHYKWWEKDIDWLKNNAELFEDIELFEKELLDNEKE